MRPLLIPVFFVKVAHCGCYSKLLAPLVPLDCDAGRRPRF